MRFAVAGHKPCAVHGKQHIQLHQVDIVDNLVVGTLEKRGINGHGRQQPLACQAARKGDGVFLSHTDIKKAFLVRLLEEVQPCAVFHGGGDGAQARFLAAQLCQRLTKGGREGVRRRKFGVGQVAEVQLAHGVELAGVFLGGLQPLALLGDNVQEKRGILLPQIGKHTAEQLDVMAVHRADVLKAHLLKQSGLLVDAAADKLLAVLQHPDHGITDYGDALERSLHVCLDVEILGVGAQAGQIVSDLADVFGDGHLVVVQNHDQIVQLADIVHALIDHTAGERAVTYNDDHLAALALDFFCLRHADGSRKRCTAVPGNEAVTVAFLGVGETR